MKLQPSTVLNTANDSGTQSFNRDPFLWTIITTAAGLLVLGVLFAIVGKSSPAVVIPGIQPVSITFLCLTSLSLAFLALGRYHVLRDPTSYWLGIGFLIYGVGQVFYLLTWPGLLADGRSILASLPNTTTFITIFDLSLLVVFLLAALFMQWPGKTTYIRRWQITAAAWLILSISIFIVIVAFERYLPVLSQPDGTFTLLLKAWDLILALLYTVGAVRATQEYRKTRGELLFALALLQIIWVFVLLMTIISVRRYDVAWYVERVVSVTGFLVVLFGLFYEYVRQLRRERESDARFRQLTESLPLLMWTSTPDGLCDYLSPQWIEFTGVSAEQQLGLGWLQQIHPDDRQSVIETWNSAVKEKKSYNIELRLHRRQGEYCWFKAQAVPIRDLEGRIVRWFGSCTEIQEQKNYAAQLEQRNRDLENFTLVASHDLQEPLRKIETIGDAVLERGSNLDQRQKDYLLRMRKAAQQMRNMVNGLLQLTLMNSDYQSFQPVNMSRVTGEILDILQDKIQQSRARVSVTHLPVIEADPNQMRMLMLHLLENAIKFQPSDHTPEIKVYSTQSGLAAVQIFVEDNGIGFDETHAQHLFEPFERLVGKNQPEYEGAGIGLAICRWIVEQHGGEITAHSQPGIGTTFVVTLPTRRTSSTESQAREESQSERNAIPTDR